MKLGYVIVYVPDVAAAIQFYENAFELTRRFIAPDAGYGEMETGATALAFAANSLVQGQGVNFVPNAASNEAPGIEIALVAGDVQAALDRAVRAGALLVKAPITKPWGQTVAYVRDLNGVLVELCTPVSV